MNWNLGIRAPKLVFTDLVGYVWKTAEGKEMVSDLGLQEIC